MEFESMEHQADVLRKISLPEGISDEIFQQFKVKPMKYKVILNPENEKHCQFLARLLQQGIVDFQSCTVKTLGPFGLGFDTEDAEKLLEELKETREKQGESYAAWQHGEQNIQATTERQNKNSDPEKVAKFRADLAKLTEKVGYDRTMFETLGRKAEELHLQLFKSVKQHREDQVKALREKIQPVLERFNKGIRELYSDWSLNGAPLLQKIGEMDGETPGNLYYSTPNLVMDSPAGSQYAVSPDLALVKLKRFQLHPVIRNGADGKRLEFALEETK